jgi:tRNA A-37 threonylcarbamoyl transferase component Bud32
LGKGGFGITYLAKRNDGKQVVIKTLNENMQNQREFNKFQQKFIKEAFLMRGLDHPHIVKVLDICPSVNLQCMVMEYVEGESLFERVDRNGALSEDDALRYIKQIGSALDYMHNPKLHPDPILHRDLNPKNIMLRRNPDEAILIDFGLAREFTPDATGTHTAQGFFGFCPIEQLDERRKRGAYTDVYGLAAAFYYALTRQFPPDVRDIMIKTARLLPPKQHNANVSDAVSKAILWGMKLEPKDRPQTVQKWLERLDIAKPVKPVEPPKKIPYRALAIGGGLYAINTFCLVFFHVLTWQIAKEMAVLFLLPFATSWATLVWLEKSSWSDISIVLPPLVVAIVTGALSGYLFGGNNWTFGGAWAGAWAWAWVLAGAFTWNKIHGGLKVFLWALIGALIWSGARALSSASSLSWSVPLSLAWAIFWAITFWVAEKNKSTGLERLALVCFFLPITPLPIPFIFANENISSQYISEQEMYQITMGTIVSGLIVGGGLGLLTLLIIGR